MSTYLTKLSPSNVSTMLLESNKIEGIYDSDSLVQARKAWDYLMDFYRLDNRVVKRAHEILMKNQDIEEKYKGEFRDIPVMIGGLVKNQPRIVIDSLMRDLCDDINGTLVGGFHDPMDFHIRFEGIHPFIDGNGRLGRILMNWQSVRMRTDRLIIIEEEGKEEYYKIFKFHL